MNHIHEMHAGDKALAENLTIVLRSRDPAKLRSEVSPNKKVLFCISACKTFIADTICLKLTLDKLEIVLLVLFTYPLTGLGMTGEDCN